MKNKLDITDTDIDNLFNNDDTSSLLEDKDEKVELPEELSIEKETKPTKEAAAHNKSWPHN